MKANNLPNSQLKTSRVILLNLSGVFCILIIWYLVSVSGLVRPIFLPSPHDTFSSLVELIISGKFFKAFIISFTRILVATFFASIVGSIIGVLMGFSKKVEAILSPITQPLRYLPITALIPLLVLWFGIGESMKVFFLFIGIVFYFIPLVRNAIRTVSIDHVDTARSFGASKWFIIKKIYWPHSLPQIFDGLIVVNGIGWTYVVLAEIINAKEGIGYLINIAGRLQRSEEVFAALILIALVAIGSDRLLHYIRDKYFFW